MSAGFRSLLAFWIGGAASAAAAPAVWTDVPAVTPPSVWSALGSPSSPWSDTASPAAATWSPQATPSSAWSDVPSSSNVWTPVTG